MNWHEAENKVKLHILHSLARSQRALARMLESMAEMVQSYAESGSPDRSDSGSGTGSSLVPGEKLLEQLTAISGCQKQLAVKLTGIRIRRFRRGRPGKLWLNDRLRRYAVLRAVAKPKKK